MITKYAAIAILAISLIACKKENDVENPVITISSPVTNQTFESEDSVAVKFTVKDADLHEVGFKITIKDSDSVLYSKAKSHTHDNPYVWDRKLKLVVSDHTDAVLTVEAEDHNGNATTKSVNFHIHPLK